MSTEQGTDRSNCSGLGPGRLTNGLEAPRFVALLDVDSDVAAPLLDALRRARIAAFADPAGPAAGLRRVHVAAAELADARPIALSALRALRPEAGARAWQDPLDGVDTEAVFGELVADWQVDTVAAVRAAERDLARENADWRARLQVPEAAAEEDDHYVPPPPPPLPRLAAATVGALAVLLLSLAVLVFGGRLGLAGDVSVMLGIAGILISAGLLVMRLRYQRDDGDDDGAIV